MPSFMGPRRQFGLTQDQRVRAAIVNPAVAEGRPSLPTQPPIQSAAASAPRPCAATITEPIPSTLRSRAQAASRSVQADARERAPGPRGQAVRYTQTSQIKVECAFGEPVGHVGWHRGVPCRLDVQHGTPTRLK